MIPFVLIASAFGSTVVDRVAASVNDEVITLTEVYDLGKDFILQSCPQGPTQERCVAEKELEVLDALIRNALQQQELQRLQMQVTGQEVDQAIDRIVREYDLADRATLRKEIELQGMRWEQYREQLTDQLRRQKFQQIIIHPQITVTDDEVRDRYQRTVRDVKGELEVKLQAFAKPWPDSEEEQATVLEAVSEVVKTINAGELAWEDAVTAHDELKMGTVYKGEKAYKKGQLAKAIDTIVWKAEPGIALPPLPIGQALVVVKVTSIEEGEPEVKPFDQIEGQLRMALLEEKAGEVEEEWYQRARRQAAIDVLLEVP